MEYRNIDVDLTFIVVIAVDYRPENDDNNLYYVLLQISLKNLKSRLNINNIIIDRSNLKFSSSGYCYNKHENALR